MQKNLFSSLITLLLAAFAMTNATPQVPPKTTLLCTSDKAPRAQSRLRAAYGGLPLSFEANRGQAARQARFLARSGGFHLFLTPKEAVFSLLPNRKLKIENRKYAVLRMRLAGANPAPRMAGVSPLPGRVNYLLGNDPNRWHTDIPTYGKVRYAGVYPGIDLVYYGNRQQLEYDFVVQPGANPKAIRLAFAGAQKMRVQANGDLALSLSGGEIRWRKPVIYQEINGKRQFISGRYALLDRPKSKIEIGFQIAKYDICRPLVIDPTLLYATFLGGSDYDYGKGIAVDSSGNAFVTGIAFSTNFPTTSGAYQTGFGGTATDVFVAKLNATGTALTYCTYLGGSGTDNGFGIAVDSSGSAYVTGYTASSDFPHRLLLTVQRNYGGGTTDAFVTKLNASGSSMSYSTFLGGVNTEYAYGIAVDSSGNAFVTGLTYSDDFPTTAGAYQTARGNGSDAFVSKINSTGTALTYSTLLGGNGNDNSFAIAVGPEGRAFVAGSTSSTNFPATSTAYQTTNGGGYDAFVTKFNDDGSARIYSTYLGGSGNDAAYGIAVDSGGKAYVTGYTASSDYPVLLGSYRITPAGGSEDAFVTKVNLLGTGLSYSFYLGGSGADRGQGIAVDGWGNAYVTGYTDSTDFPTTTGAYQTSSGGSKDAFVTKVNTTGSTLLTSTYLGGSSTDEGYGIAVDANGIAYVTGHTYSSGFPVSSGAYQTSFGGTTDAFIAKLPTYTRFDFSSDGKCDLLWRFSASGDVSYWLMNGVTQTSSGWITTAGSLFVKVVGTPDLDGDGKPDILWQNTATGNVSYWLMDGVTRTGSGWITTAGNPDWEVVGTPDLNADGKPDILWQQASTGNVAYWLLDGTTYSSGGWIVSSGNTDWVVVGAPDLDGNGKPDLLWQQTSTGGVVYYLMDGTSISSAGWVVTSGNTDWKIVGTPDLNGDGKPDLLWQQTSTGSVVYYLQDGITTTSSGWLVSSGNPKWRVVGIR